MKIWKHYGIGLALALLLTLALTALTAFLLKLFDFSAGVMTAITIVIKLLSVAVGSAWLASKAEKRGALCGLLMGLSYWAACFAFVTVTDGAFTWQMKNLADLGLCALGGVFSGILAVNAFVKK